MRRFTFALLTTQLPTPVLSCPPSLTSQGGGLYLDGNAVATIDSASVVMVNNVANDGNDIYASASTIGCTSSCGLNEFAASCSLADASTGMTDCPVNCGACTTCPDGTASSMLGVTSLTASPPSQCACNQPNFLSYVGSTSCDYWYVSLLTLSSFY